MPWVNHVANPGGEYVSGGSVVFWRGNVATVTSAASPLLDGTASVQVVSSASTQGVGIPFVAPSADQPLLYQAYIYQNVRPGGVATQVTIRDMAFTFIGAPVPDTSATVAWTRVIGTAPALTPGSAYMLYVRVGGAGTVWVDRAAVWQGSRDDALAWSAQLPLFVVEVAPGYGAADLYSTGSALVAGSGGSALAHRVGTPWTDVSWRVRRGSYRGGRTAETEQTNAATLGVTLDNRDGALDPTTGTMGSVGMPVRVRVADPSTGRLDYLVEGQVWTVRPQRPGPYDQVVEFGAVDRWKTLAMATWRPVSDRGEGEAHLAILNPAIDLGYGRIGSGTSDTIVEAVGTADSFGALDFMQTCARSDGGRLVDHPLAGTYVEGRRMRYGTATPVATFGTAVGEVPYGMVEPVADDSYLFNDWTVTAQSGTVEARYTDATSGTTYGYRAQTVETRIGTADSAQAADAAAFYALRYAYPKVRIPRVAPNLAALGTAAPWSAIMGAHRNAIEQVAAGETYAKPFIVKRPVIGSSGGTATHVVWPEGCSVEWEPGRVAVALDVSPAEITTVWRLDEGQLDSTTRLAW